MDLVTVDWSTEDELKDWRKEMQYSISKRLAERLSASLCLDMGVVWDTHVCFSFKTGEGCLGAEGTKGSGGRLWRVILKRPEERVWGMECLSPGITWAVCPRLNKQEACNKCFLN